jgi:hypothetical protein
MFDPQANLQQPCIVVAAAGQLDTDRQTVRPMPGGQGQAGHRELRPRRVEDGGAGVGKSPRRLPRRR